MTERPTLAVASGNAHKIKEIAAALAGSQYLVLGKREAGSVAGDPEETGTSFEENALIKAGALFREIGVSSLADDSGLEVDALGGAPGVLSARFSGEGTDEANVSKLLRLLDGAPDEERGARFVCALALRREDRDDVIVRGECRGIIVRAPLGTRGFGYDPIFVPDEDNPEALTFGEMSPEEKARRSHRGKALAALSETLAKERASEA